MKMPSVIDKQMLAPCGMNCMVCYKHLTPKKPCQGCFTDSVGKPDHCQKCSRKSCASSKGLSHCFVCDSFPCKLIKTLDKSYRTRYGISLVQNGETARVVGLEQFMVEEQARWSCPDCAGVISLHDAVCSECSRPLGR